MKNIKETQVRVRVTHEDLNAFRAFAAKEGTTMAALMRQYMREAILQSEVCEWID